MSSYEFHDFRAIDRSLTAAQVREVEKMSSRVDLTPQRAAFTYHYSSFRYDTLTVLEEYFDAVMYISSYGDRRLAFRIPAGLVDYDGLAAYLPYFDASEDVEYDHYFLEEVTINRKGDYVIVDFNQAAEDGGEWLSDEGWLSILLPIRDQLMAGDYRVLYLAWLAMIANSSSEEVSDLLEPPVPPGLNRLDAALECFTDFWGIPSALIDAAAEAATAPPPASTNWADQLTRLTDEERREFLTALTEDAVTARQLLLTRLRQLRPSRPPAPPAADRRTAGELRTREEHFTGLRKQKKEHAAAAGLKKRMEALAPNVSTMWQQAEQQAALRNKSGYNEAAKLLNDLHQYAHYTNDLSGYRVKRDGVMEAANHSNALERRLKKFGG
ncbi:MAG: hypothetical protein WBA17_14935 [Saprospiraceae bacterium]